MIKLSQYETLPGFNHVASALFRENNLDPADFERLFPDQVSNVVTFDDFFNKVPRLKGTDEFVERLMNFNRFSPICVFGDYDKQNRKNS